MNVHIFNELLAYYLQIVFILGVEHKVFRFGNKTTNNIRLYLAHNLKLFVFKSFKPESAFSFLLSAHQRSQQ